MIDPAPSPSQEHLNLAGKRAFHDPVKCAVLTVSDTRTEETDVGGNLVRELLIRGGHRVSDAAIIQDVPDLIREQLKRWIEQDTIDVILTTGGTGISLRDGTVEVVRELLTTELEGFGELFRMLSYKQVGGAAMLSRAVAGLVVDSHTSRATFIFTMPGSPNAVETAMIQLITPQLNHLVWERKKQPR
jgi:molybdenum cofactor biosynthesis protein B